jgi:hypothetical protein
MNYSSEGKALLPWERGLPNCTSPTLTHPMSGQKGVSTASSIQTTPSSNHNGTQFGSSRNGGSDINNLVVRINVIFMIIYFTAEWF